MEKRRLGWLMAVSAVLILLVILFLALTMPQRSGYIHLPQLSDVASDGAQADGENSALPVVEITTETVQRVIAVMTRPERYQRTVRVTNLWEGGSATEEIQTAVDGDLLRTDRTMADGSVRHLLRSGETTYIWYDDEIAAGAFPTGSFSADAECRIPTYEDILSLDTEDISLTVYGEYEGIYCICVVTEPDEELYSTAYWISVDSGLLVAAETRQEDTLICMVAALEPYTQPEEGAFLLPDGSEPAR